MRLQEQTISKSTKFSLKIEKKVITILKSCRTFISLDNTLQVMSMMREYEIPIVVPEEVVPRHRLRQRQGDQHQQQQYNIIINDSSYNDYIVYINSNTNNNSSVRCKVIVRNDARSMQSKKVDRIYYSNSIIFVTLFCYYCCCCCCSTANHIIHAQELIQTMQQQQYDSNDIYNNNNLLRRRVLSKSLHYQSRRRLEKLAVVNGDSVVTDTTSKKMTTTTTTTTEIQQVPQQVQVQQVQNDANTNVDENHVNVLIQYLQSMKGGTDNIVILQWNEQGLLYRYTPVRNRMWFRAISHNTTYKQTKPSKYGTIALLLNTDILQFLDWTIIPPVPILVFTLPDKFINNNNKYFLLPDPYDVYGFNEFCVKRLNELIGSQIQTYEQYMNRSNSIVWRGESHDNMDPIRQTIIQMSNELDKELAIQNTSTSTTKKKNRWLDVADTRKDPTAKLEMEQLVANYRYQIDIGGVSGTSWGGTRWKLCMGTLTFKVDTFSKDWWHYDLIEWKHYIPIKSDLSNLYEMYMWVENNSQEAYTISQSGKEQCLKTLSQPVAETTLSNIIYNLPSVSDPSIIQDATAIYNNKTILQQYFVPIKDDYDYNNGYTTNVNINIM